MNTGPVRVPGILLLYHLPLEGGVAATIREHINSFSLHSRFPVWEVNSELGFPRNLPGLRFDAIVLHYSLFGLGYEYKISRAFREYLASCEDSLLIGFFQDEYRYCQKRFSFINYLHMDTIYTLLEPRYHDEVYGKHTGAKHILYCLPGYVSDTLPQIAENFSRPASQRTIDIGYRARRLEFYMGMGAQEKQAIGTTFQRLCRKNNVPLRIDIDIGEKSRLYGEEWYRFQGNCRGMLGTESGVSLFDIDDEVRVGCEKLIEQNRHISFEEVYRTILHTYDNVISYRMISPRHFESAAFKTCQILFEGTYSGVLKPDVHYIPLKKDFSNFASVIKRFQNTSEVAEITDRAYNSLIASGTYSYSAFMKTFDDHLAECGLAPPRVTVDRSCIDAVLYHDLHSLKRRRSAELYMKKLLRLNFPGRKKILSMIRRMFS